MLSVLFVMTPAPVGRRH